MQSARNGISVKPAIGPRIKFPTSTFPIFISRNITYFAADCNHRCATAYSVSSPAHSALPPVCSAPSPAYSAPPPAIPLPLLLIPLYRLLFHSLSCLFGSTACYSTPRVTFSRIHKIATPFLMLFRGGKNVFSLKCCLIGCFPMLFHEYLPLSGVAKMCLAQKVTRVKHPFKILYILIKCSVSYAL